MKETKFKQTELGMIPSDWEVKKIGELTNVLTGFPFPGNTILENGNVRLLRGVNITEGQIRHSDDIDRFYSGNIESLREYALREDDLVIGMDGSKVGKNSAIIHKNESGNLLVQRVARLRVKNSKQPISYLFYFISSNNFIAYIDSLKTNSAIPHISPADIRNYTIPLPSKIEEQQHIANALSDVDTLINNLEKLIAKKKNIKQGAMQQLLTGKKRLPGFGSDERTGSRPTDERRKACHSERSAKREVEESSGYKMTELGLIPSDWEVKTFGELFDILPNNTLSRAELNEDSGSFKNIHYGDVLVKFPEWIDCSKNTLPFINSGAKFNHTALQDGDVIIADTAEDETVGKSTEIYNVGKMKIVSGLHTIPIRPKKKFASKWLGYFINSACWHDQILPFITGTKVSAISKTAIAETKFFYPAKIDEQTAIANVLSDMDTEISALETKLAKYRTLKTGMMQQLLTGKIRLV
ncbi:restriction endonuclease subunit S [uncultured Fibrobacter sp.]|uniref:restriction endonuclease subunit S n=1 Tax=uncultured Fibrobacter sp. TaxID=261512 RepID=UPI0025ED79DC|nr:restriction endonuclease subunit S [uncultured Fibrobacter sp.]